MSDATPGERIGLPCPACSPDIETVHEVLKPGGHVTVRCTECDHVHKETLPEAATVQRDVVVSQDGESFSAQVDVPEGEQLAVGEEFLLETDEAIMTVRITSLEVGEGRQDEAVGSGAGVRDAPVRTDRRSRFPRGWEREPRAAPVRRPFTPAW